MIQLLGDIIYKFLLSCTTNNSAITSSPVTFSSVEISTLHVCMQGLIYTLIIFI